MSVSLAPYFDVLYVFMQQAANWPRSWKGYGHMDHVSYISKYRIISQSEVGILIIFNLIVSWKDILSKYRIIGQSKVTVTIIGQYINFTCLICFANAHIIFALNWQDPVMALMLVTNPAGECWYSVIYYLCIVKENTTLVSQLVFISVILYAYQLVSIRTWQACHLMLWVNLQ